MLGKVNTGGVAIPYAAIAVEYDVGAECVCTNGIGKTLYSKSDNGKWIFPIPYNGTWTVTVTNSSFTKSEVVEITRPYQTKKVRLFSYADIYNSGRWGWICPNEMTNNVISGTAGWNGANCTFGENSIIFNTSGNYINGIRTNNKIEFKKNQFTELHTVFSSFTPNTNRNGGALIGISNVESMSGIENISQIRSNMLAYTSISASSMSDVKLAIPGSVESAYVYIVNMSSKSTTTRIYVT